MPEEFKNKDIPHFTLHVNVPRLPAEIKSNTNKGYDHYKEHGKKAFHFKVAKDNAPFFKFLASHAHQLRLENKYFGKFAKFTATLGNNAPMSDCVRLRRCIQGHLNFHLRSTSITINGIDNLDASEILQNPAVGSYKLPLSQYMCIGRVVACSFQQKYDFSKVLIGLLAYSPHLPFGHLSSGVLLGAYSH